MRPASVVFLGGIPNFVGGFAGFALDQVRRD